MSLSAIIIIIIIINNYPSGSGSLSLVYCHNTAYACIVQQQILYAVFSQVFLTCYHSMMYVIRLRESDGIILQKINLCILDNGRRLLMQQSR